jgi:methylglyoxal synthase
VPSPTTVALIAHDGKKADLATWASTNRSVLATFRILATRSTARLIRDRVGLTVEEMLGGPEGGDIQIGALVATGSVDAVFFLEDPLMAMPHEPDIEALLRICNVHNVPLATNVATAGLVLTGLLHSPGGAATPGAAAP